MNYPNRSLKGKKSILIIACGLAFSLTNGQQSQTFNYSGSMTSFTVPCGVTTLTIQAIGAGGGANGNYNVTPGGLGASMQGTFTVTPSEVLEILVGGQGQEGSGNETGGGGGGSFVTDNLNNPFIIAGGGGGGGYNYATYANASTGTSGNQGGGTCECGTGGTNKGGGGGGNESGGGGGGGLVGNGGYGTGGASCGGPGTGGNDANGGNATGCNGDYAYGGNSFVNGGAGGTCSPDNPTGGFGGGGAGSYSWYAGGGGGGGYSGGGGGGSDAVSGCGDDAFANCGGGGGSYNGGSNQTNTAGVESGNGQITIYWNTAGPITLSGNVIKNVLCNGGSTGEASGIVTGGGAPYTYSWIPAAGSRDTASGLSAGNYTITVQDGCGHSATASVSITQPTALSVSVSASSNVLCNGESNGSASSNVSGGTSPYTYAWSNLQLTPNATGLSAGTYTIGVSDGNGCTATASVSISQPNVLSASPSVISNVLCNGESDGSASSNASGGTSPYTYLWSNAESNSNATGLSAGTYIIGVSDGNGCTASASVSITQPTALNISATALTNVLCNGGTDGSASSSASGGTSPYTYLWNNAESNSNATGLSAGTYTIGVSDGNGCTTSASVSITQPNALSASPSAISNVSCNGESNGSLSSNASGGTSPYTYLWSNLQSSPNATGLSAGTYTLGLTDANGCTASASVGITQPVAIGIISHSQADNGSGNGAAWVNVSGGTGPYTYLWNPGGNSTDSISKKDSGMYCCLVTDANGCTDSTCIKIKSTLGIGNITSGSGGITVYPNPNNGQFTIQSSVVSGQSLVEVYNILGEKIYSQLSTFNSPLSINLGNQPNGIYLYRVISESGSLMGEGRIMVQK